MGLKHTRNINLGTLFLRYLAAFCVTTIIFVSMILLSFYFALNTGIILPANHAEQELMSIQTQLKESEPFDKSIIPYTSRYCLFDLEGNVIESNMAPREIKKATESLLTHSKRGSAHYMYVQRQKEYVVIQYDLFAHYASPSLHKIFPKPEVFAILISMLGFLFMAFMTAWLFSRKLKKELLPIVVATHSIKEQDLDFEISSTQIKEFNEILSALDEMKTTLGTSLKTQWEMEENRKTQIAALAHDIKTPLTVIKGNAELLLETDLKTDDKELIRYIDQNSDKIQEYLELLIMATKSQDLQDFNPKQFRLNDMICEIKQQSLALSSTKNIIFTVSERGLPDMFYGDRELILRAMINIISNAVEYSPPYGEISLKVVGDKNSLSFCVTDTGKGFSKEALKNATQQFFTEHKERSTKHYGFGLFIADRVAKKHGGSVEIKNNTNTCGATVTLTIKGL